VDVFALRKEGKPEFEMIAGVQVFRLHTRGFQEKRRASFFQGGGSFFVKAWGRVAKSHLLRLYDFFPVYSLPHFLVFVALVPKLMGAKVVLDVHDILPELYASKFGVGRKSLGFKIMLFLERVSAAFADHVITANHLWQERLLSRSVAPGKCTTLMN